MSEKIKDILMEHRGRKNAIAAKRISEAMGFPMEDTQSVSRQAIWDTAEEYGLPLISCNKGYFIAQTDEEMDDYKVPSRFMRKFICRLRLNEVSRR